MLGFCSFILLWSGKVLLHLDEVTFTAKKKRFAQSASSWAHLNGNLRIWLGISRNKFNCIFVTCQYAILKVIERSSIILIHGNFHLFLHLMALYATLCLSPFCLFTQLSGTLQPGDQFGRAFIAFLSAQNGHRLFKLHLHKYKIKSTNRSNCNKSSRGLCGFFSRLSAFSHAQIIGDDYILCVDSLAFKFKVKVFIIIAADTLSS